MILTISKQDKSMGKILAKNKKAYFDYEILESYEAGIILIGSEVKSIKEGKVQLVGSYVSARNGEVWLVGTHISPYKSGQVFEPERPRKLLLSKKEIIELIGKLQTKGTSLIPIEIYLKKNLIKVRISVARGKKKYDKRETIKKRELERSLRRNYKNIKI